MGEASEEMSPAMEDLTLGEGATLDEVSLLKEENVKLTRKLEDMSSEVAVANLVKESLVDLERRNADLQAEMTTLQSLLNESVQETSTSKTKYEHEIARIKAVLGQLQSENRELKFSQANSSSLDNSGAGGGGVGDKGDKDAFNAFSDATKFLSRKMKTNFTSAVTNLVPIKSPTTEDLHALAASEAAVVTTTAEDVSTGQRQAAQDAQLLKSIVEPLEQQIGALKQKLRDTDLLLVESEKRQAKSTLGMSALTTWLSGQASLDQALLALKEKQSELLTFSELKSKDQDENERAATDSLYISAMNARVAILTGEIAAARAEMANQAELANRAMRKSEEFKAQIAAVTSQNAKLKTRHLTQMNVLSTVLTPEQKVQVKAALESSQSDNQGDQDKEPTSVNGIDPVSEGDDVLPVRRIDWENLNREVEKVHSLLGVGAEEHLVGGSQLTKLQEELEIVKRECESHAKSEDRLKEELVKESQVRATVEAEWNAKADQHKCETELLQEQLQKSEEILESLRSCYTANYKATRKDLAKLTTEREEIVRELK